MTSPRLTPPDNFVDFIESTKHILNTYPENDIYFLGFSLGGNIMLRYLSLFQNSIPKLKAVVSVSTCFDVNDASDRLGQGVVEEYFIQQFREKMFEPNYEFLRQFEDKYGFSFEKMRKARTLRELHQEYTCKVFGIKTTHELFNYYKVTEDHLRAIEVPCLILHAKDDDLCPTSFIPKRIFTEKENLFYAETNHGGHIGWLQGYFPPTLWTDKPIFGYLQHFYGLGSI